ncbi:MAG: hypothetical protein IPL53_14310 [Ignavibacteria bacterium]|nr:hypothetical protein [Ignavibacteria bacterium]
MDGNGMEDIVVGANGIQVGSDFVGRCYIYDPSNNNSVSITGNTDPEGFFGASVAKLRGRR